MNNNETSLVDNIIQSGFSILGVIELNSLFSWDPINTTPRGYYYTVDRSVIGAVVGNIAYMGGIQSSRIY